MDRKTNVFWATVAFLTVLAGIVLCYWGTNIGVLFARPSGNPQDAVIGFFDSIKAGNYQAACSFTDNYSSIGLENVPDSEEGQLMFSALKKSIDYSLSGNCALAGVQASQKVLVRYLDLAAVDEAARALTELEYITALRQVLSDCESLCTSEFYDITVTYSGGKWLMEMDSALLSALQGGCV